MLFFGCFFFLFFSFLQFHFSCIKFTLAYSQSITNTELEINSFGLNESALNTNTVVISRISAIYNHAICHAWISEHWNPSCIWNTEHWYCSCITVLRSEQINRSVMLNFMRRRCLVHARPKQGQQMKKNRGNDEHTLRVMG